MIQIHNRHNTTMPIVAAIGLIVSIAYVPSVWSQTTIPIVPAGDVNTHLESPVTVQSVPGEVIVKMKSDNGDVSGLQPQDLAPLGLQTSPRRTSGDEEIYRFTNARLFGLQSEAEAIQATADVVAELNAREDVEYAQPNWIMHPVDTTPDDPGYPIQWHYFNNGTAVSESPGGINLPRAWDTTTGAATVVVAVIDTGILPNHADIVGTPNLIAGYDMISDTFIANDGDGRDADPRDPGDAVAANECGPGTPARSDSWHGTHVAGTVGVLNTNNGSGVSGVNWNIAVLPLRVLGKCGGTTVDINDAIRWAAGLPVPGVPTNPNAASVINLSLGGRGSCSASPSTQAAVNDAVGAGVSVVVAAGNNAEDAANFIPASCDNVITVAASDYRGHLVERYSNFGDSVEIMAPGGDVQRDDDGDSNPDGVLSTVKGGYAFYNGTSMAAPHVAGVAALLISQEPLLSPSEVTQRLQDFALPRDTTQCSKPCGAGLLNADLFDRPKPPTGYQYAAKLVCGVQKDVDNLQLLHGVYSTVVNIHNPDVKPAMLRKTLALAIPPGSQEAGEVKRIGEDVLAEQHTLATDCEDIRNRVFDGQFPNSFIDGFVVLESDSSLDVTAFYSSAVLGRDGKPSNHSGIHVEQIKERVIKTGDEEGQPDLVVKDIDIENLRVSCPAGQGSCVTELNITIANQGSIAGSFNTRVQLDPNQSVILDNNSAGLGAGSERTFIIKSPPGDNCFDPDCTVCVAVDNLDVIVESDETNNRMCANKPG